MFQSPLHNPSAGTMMAMVKSIQKQTENVIGLKRLKKIPSEPCLQKSEGAVSPHSVLSGHFHAFADDGPLEDSREDTQDPNSSDTSAQNSRTFSDDDPIPVVDTTSRKSMTIAMQDDWKDCYVSSVLTESNCQSLKQSADSYHSVDKCRCHFCTGGSDIASTSSTAATTSTCTTVRNIPLEMAELMEKMEEELHVTCSTKNLVMIEDDHPDENRSFTSAGTCCTDLQELDDLIDDIFLNNMERQWCGKDHLMEHVEHIASLNAPVSFASMEDPFADMD